MFSWNFPYSSQRMPLLAKNVVATSQPLAAQAGVQMLAKGGNAVDAGLAAAITLTVVEPTSNGIGSDAFAILWDGQRLVGLNASGRAPAGWTPERFAGRTAMPTLGWDAVTVPGCVSAWVALSKRYGKLPFEALFEHVPSDAVRLCIFERKNEHFPHEQPSSFYEDARRLHGWLGGSALRFGVEDEHALYLFATERPYEPDDDDVTIEV